MSKPTHCSLQKLKKLVGYLRELKSIAWRLKLQSRDRANGGRLFSAGFWKVSVMPIGPAISSIGALQERAVSLSSCEIELRALTSTLAHSLFIKHCMQFLTNAEVEQHLFTDSSSARQLVMKQGVGKAKHIAGKLLWIQDAVQRGSTTLVQVPTLWNLSEIGTKPLGAKRLFLLLHEVGVAVGEGVCAVGAQE